MLFDRAIPPASWRPSDGRGIPDSARAHRRGDHARNRRCRIPGRFAAYGPKPGSSSLPAGPGAAPVRCHRRQLILAPGAPLEWEKVSYYVNGNRSMEGEPELRSSTREGGALTARPSRWTALRYAWWGDTVDGARLRLAFEPAAADASDALYHARRWMDRIPRAPAGQRPADQPGASGGPNGNRRLPPRGRTGGTAFWMLARVYASTHWTVAASTCRAARGGFLSRLNPSARPSRMRAPRPTRAQPDRAQTDHGLRSLSARRTGRARSERWTRADRRRRRAYKDQSTSGWCPGG